MRTFRLVVLPQICLAGLWFSEGGVTLAVVKKQKGEFNMSTAVKATGSALLDILVHLQPVRLPHLRPVQRRTRSLCGTRTNVPWDEPAASAGDAPAACPETHLRPVRRRTRSLCGARTNVQTEEVPRGWQDKPGCFYLELLNLPLPEAAQRKRKMILCSVVQVIRFAQLQAVCGDQLWAALSATLWACQFMFGWKCTREMVSSLPLLTPGSWAVVGPAGLTPLKSNLLILLI